MFTTGGAAVLLLLNDLLLCVWVSVCAYVARPAASLPRPSKVDCLMARVVLSEVDAQNKEADKQQWRVVAKRAQIIFRRVELYDAQVASGR